MIDRVSNLGFFEVTSPTTFNTSAAGTGTVGGGIFNLIVSQAQGRVAFYMDAAASSVAGATLNVALQTAPDNATWSNVFYPAGSSVAGNQVKFTTVTNIANTAGLQAIFVDSALLSQYNRVYATVTGASAGFVASVIAVYPQKNA